jgi:hypothetical protein
VSPWEWQAEDWARWARTPGHDSYWLFRDLFFDAIVPTPGRLTLEVGCGEGASPTSSTSARSSIPECHT